MECSSTALLARRSLVLYFVCFDNNNHHKKIKNIPLPIRHGSARTGERSEKVNGDDVADWVRSDCGESFFLSWESFLRNFYFDNRLWSPPRCLEMCMNDVGRDVKQGRDCRAQTLNFRTNRTKRERRKKHQKICNIAQVCENLFAGAAEDKWNYHELLFSERCAPISSLICNFISLGRSLPQLFFIFVVLVSMMDSRKRNFTFIAALHC